MNNWICTSCDEVFYGMEYSEYCPLCRVKDSWKDLEEERKELLEKALYDPEKYPEE